MSFYTNNSNKSVRRSKRLWLLQNMGSEFSSPRNDNQKIRPWSDLPNELLNKIGEQLPLIELLGFRSTCRDWRSASSTASGESSLDQAPWLLLYNNGELDVDSSSRSNCRLYQPSTEKVYSIEIPELNGTTCIASKEGWLLLLRGRSIFFFYPFSRVKIDLPDLPDANIYNPVATFSTTPTSEDCIVCVMHDLNENSKVMNRLKCGADQWERHTKEGLGKTSGAAFSDGVFYFSDAKYVVTFDVETEKLMNYTIVHSGKGEITSPFKFTENYFQNDLKQKLGLSKDVSLSICGTVHTRYLIHNEDIKAEEDVKHQNKGVWIHPRFFQVPGNQSWSL